MAEQVVDMDSLLEEMEDDERPASPFQLFVISGPDIMVQPFRSISPPDIVLVGFMGQRLPEIQLEARLPDQPPELPMGGII